MDNVPYLNEFHNVLCTAILHGLYDIMDFHNVAWEINIIIIIMSYLSSQF
jgi:hypothetical protein